jgi:hypothetical protein
MKVRISVRKINPVYLNTEKICLFKKNPSKCLGWETPCIIKYRITHQIFSLIKRGQKTHNLLTSKKIFKILAITSKFFLKPIIVSKSRKYHKSTVLRKIKNLTTQNKTIKSYAKSSGHISFPIWQKINQVYPNNFRLRKVHNSQNQRIISSDPAINQYCASKY